MANEEKEGAWVKIVIALIAGGATVLAATLPLYFTSQRELKKRTETADSESSTLRKQIDALLSQIKERDTEIAALKDQLRNGSIPIRAGNGDSTSEPPIHAVQLIR